MGLKSEAKAAATVRAAEVALQARHKLRWLLEKRLGLVVETPADATVTIDGLLFIVRDDELMVQLWPGEVRKVESLADLGEML